MAALASLSPSPRRQGTIQLRQTTPLYSKRLSIPLTLPADKQGLASPFRDQVYPSPYHAIKSTLLTFSRQCLTAQPFRRGRTRHPWSITSCQGLTSPFLPTRSDLFPFARQGLPSPLTPTRYNPHRSRRQDLASCPPTSKDGLDRQHRLDLFMHESCT